MKAEERIAKVNEIINKYMYLPRGKKDPVCATDALDEIDELYTQQSDRLEQQLEVREGDIVAERERQLQVHYPVFSQIDAANKREKRYSYGLGFESGIEWLQSHHPQPISEKEMFKPGHDVEEYYPEDEVAQPISEERIKEVYDKYKVRSRDLNAISWEGFKAALKELNK